jgi:hypothetical protein
MEGPPGPSVRTTATDKPNNVTYHVMAYRKLTDDEMMMAIRLYHSQPKVRRRKTPLRNKVITIISILGLRPNT